MWAVFAAGVRAALVIQEESAETLPILSESAKVVAGGRFELYSSYPILVRAVPASVIATR